MIVRIVIAILGISSGVAFGQSTEIATCHNPSGTAYRHYAGSQDKKSSGWQEERISNGVVTLVQDANKKFDMLYVDTRKKPISMLQDGAKIIVLRSGTEEISLLAHYGEGSSTEIYSFFRESDGSNKYTVVNSRLGPTAFAPKSSLMVGTCDQIRFDLIRYAE